MATGTVLLHLGLWRRSPGGIALAALFGPALALYIKVVEERELAARFGEEYLAYRLATPALVPRLGPSG